MKVKINYLIDDVDGSPSKEIVIDLNILKSESKQISFYSKYDHLGEYNFLIHIADHLDVRLNQILNVESI